MYREDINTEILPKYVEWLMPDDACSIPKFWSSSTAHVMTKLPFDEISSAKLKLA